MPSGVCLNRKSPGLGKVRQGEREKKRERERGRKLGRTERGQERMKKERREIEIMIRKREERGGNWKK